MVCHRCSGLMVREEFGDFAFGSRGYEPVGWRCVNCGAIVDPLIAAHQRGAGEQGLRDFTKIM